MSGRGAWPEEAPATPAGRAVWAPAAKSAAAARPAGNGSRAAAGWGAHGTAAQDSAESFQARWQSMLAAIGSGSAQGETEEAGEIHGAASPESDARPAAGGPARGAMRLAPPAGGAQHPAPAQDALLKKPAAGPEPDGRRAAPGAASEGASGGESKSNASAAATLKASARQAEGERTGAAGPVADFAAGSSADQAAALAIPAKVPAEDAPPAELPASTEPRHAPSVVHAPELAAAGKVFARQPGTAAHPLQPADTGVARPPAEAAARGVGSSVDEDLAGRNAGSAEGAAVAAEPEPPAGARAPGSHSHAAAQVQGAGGQGQPRPSPPPGVAAANREPRPARLNPTDSGSAQSAAPAATSSGGGGRPAEQITGAHNSREAAPAVAAAPAGSSSGASDAALFARNPDGRGGGVHGLHEAPGGSGAAFSAGSRETFAALDAEPAANGPHWIHAGAQQAEAGFEDPALGWVGVRAELSGGGIHAAVVPGSEQAAQLLGGQMAALGTHLAAEHVPLASLSMAAAMGRESGGDGPYGQGQPQQDRGQQDSGQPETQPGTRGGAAAEGARISGMASGSSPSAALSGNLAAKGGQTAIAGAATNGIHISVLA